MQTAITHTLTKTQVDTLHRLYRREWWTSNRNRKEIEIMLRHSTLIVAIEDEAKELIGFSRILSDRIFKAEIYDIIVHPDYRDQGIGKRLIQTILSHPDLAQVQQFNLQCKAEMLPYYQQFGFTDQLDDLCYMRYTIGHL